MIMDLGWAGQLIVVLVAGLMGFLGRTIFDAWDKSRARKANAIRELERLEVLLAESKDVFVNQTIQVRALYDLIQAHCGDQVAVPWSFDEAFRQTYDLMDIEEQELFHVIRGTTIHSMYRVNAKLREWSDANMARQLVGNETEAVQTLDKQLMQMRLHLNGWFSRYEEIFKRSEKCSLVYPYPGNDRRHGIGFPRGIEDTLAIVLGEVRKSRAWLNVAKRG
jgi:hypothetical protein